jgi:hypothetical protein
MSAADTDLAVHEIGGDHRTILVPPYAEEIATIVAALAGTASK